MLNLWRGAGRDARWVMISYMLWGVGEGLWMFIQPLYLKSLDATPAQTGFVIGMWGLGRLLFVLPAGILADRWGAHRLMLPGWYTGVAGVVMIAVAPNWRWAVPGYLIYGMSAAALPATNLYITQGLRHDPTRRPDLPLQTVLALLWAAYSAGLVVSPGVGGIIGDAVGLRPVFLISVFWCLLSTLAILHTRPYPVEARPAQGYDYRGLLRRGPVIVSFALATLAFTAVYIGQALSSRYFEDVRALSRGSIGALGSVTALGTTLFSLGLGRLSAWRGFLTSLGLVAVAFGLLLASGTWPVLVLGCFMLGANQAARPFAVGIISGRAADHQRGMAYALLDTLAGLAALVGTTLAGLLYSGAPGRPFGAGIAALVAVMLLSVWALRRPARRNLAGATAYSSVEQLAGE